MGQLDGQCFAGANDGADRMLMYHGCYHYGVHKSMDQQCLLCEHLPIAVTGLGMGCARCIVCFSQHAPAPSRCTDFIST